MRKLAAAAVTMSLAAFPATATGAPPTDRAVIESASALNGKIAFASDSGGTTGEDIFAVNVDGSARNNLTNAPDSDDNAAWSPDGRKIAFRSQRDGSDEIYVMNADGSGQTNLTRSATDEELPDWSPDGTKIAFDSNNMSLTDYDVYVMNPDGTGRTNLTKDAGGGDYDADWSPDGSKIAFSSDRDGDSEVYVMNADGSGQTNLSETPGDEDYAPAWSPDGTKIAFLSSRDASHDIFLMNPDGSGQVNISNDTASDGPPAWSPDGTRIAFGSDRSGDVDIFTMNPDGSGVTNVTQDATFEEDPAWQPIPPEPSVSKGKASEGEAVRFKVRIPQPLPHIVTYDFEAEKGKAKRGRDFKKKIGIVTFAPGDTSQKVKVKTKEDGSDEPNETFFLEVSFPGGPSDRGRAKITDDD
jgi:Tol biopolymer transport system component